MTHSIAQQTDPSVSVTPITTEEVQQIFREAMISKRSVYVYREQQQPDGIVLELNNMNQIIEVDTANLVATVEPGITVRELTAVLAKEKLRFIPADTPFYQEQTIGQLFYEGYSNLAGLKYGIAKHFLMGTDIVLPTGELLKTGGKTVKNVTGYDTTRFFNGPYADLGVTVKFLLKLLPVPEERKQMVLRLAGIEQVLLLTDELRQAKITPACVFWLDECTQQIVGGNPELKGDLLLIELDGVREEVQEQWQAITELLAKHQLSWPEDSDQLIAQVASWQILFQAEQGFALHDDLKLHYSRSKEFSLQFYQAAKEKNIKAGLFGQISEGKLHMYFECLEAKQHELIQQQIIAVTSFEGYSSGKYQRLYGCNEPTSLSTLEQQTKMLFDPQQILNR